MPSEKKKPIYKNIAAYLGTAGIIIGLISGIFALDNRYAKCQEVSQIKIESSKTMQEVRIDMKKDRLLDRSDRLKDRKRDLETQQRYRPTDQNLKNDITDVNKEIIDVKKQLDKF